MERALRSAHQGYWRWGLVLATLATAALLTSLSSLLWLDRQVQDWLTGQLPQRAPTAAITLIDIDERSLADIGPWPWPRPVMAQLMQTLRDKGAGLQVWDLFFPEPAAGDDKLAQALAAQKDVVLGQVLVLDPSVQNPPQLGTLHSQPGTPPLPCQPQVVIRGHFGVAATLQPHWVGHISTTPDPDGILRRLPAVVCNAAQGYIPQLSLAAASALYPEDPWSYAPSGPWSTSYAWLTKGQARFPVDSAGQIPIPYARDHSAWPAISAAAVLAGDPAAANLKGQIVLLGSTALGVADTTNSPRSAHAPGLSVHAELLGAALDGGWVTSPASPAAYSGLLATCIALLLLPLVRLERRIWPVLAYLLPAMVLPLVLALLGRWALVMLPVAAPTVALAVFATGVLLARADFERRKSDELEQHLLSFLPAPLAHDIAQQLPAGETLGKPYQGVLMALRIQGLERWTGSVDSLQALAVAHAVSILADRVAAAHAGAVEHVRGEILVLAWHETSRTSLESALHTARVLLEQLPALLQANATVAYPLNACASIEAGAFLLGVAGPRNLRRPLLLGPAAEQVLAMLPFCEELATAVLIGPVAAALAPAYPLHALGHFLLPDQPHSRQLFRVAL